MDRLDVNQDSRRPLLQRVVGCCTHVDKVAYEHLGLLAMAGQHGDAKRHVSTPR